MGSIYFFLGDCGIGIWALGMFTIYYFFIN